MSRKSTKVSPMICTPFIVFRTSLYAYPMLCQARAISFDHRYPHLRRADSGHADVPLPSPIDGRIDCKLARRETSEDATVPQHKTPYSNAKMTVLQHKIRVNRQPYFNTRYRTQTQDPPYSNAKKTVPEDKPDRTSKQGIPYCNSRLVSEKHYCKRVSSRYAGAIHS